MAKFVRNYKKAKLLVIQEDSITDIAHRYQHCLQLYRVPPTEELSLEDFANFAIERLKVLRDVENIGIRFKKESNEYAKKMDESLKAFLPADFAPGSEKRLMNEDLDSRKKLTQSDKLENRRKDHISHYILRLAFSRSEDLRRWFLTQEIELFRYRFLQEPSHEIDAFLKLNELDFKPISDREKKERCLYLRDAGYDLTEDKVMISDYYKVHFTEAIDLVRGRRVYLEKGFAYVPRNELVSIIANTFRSQLSKALTLTARKLSTLEEDERILPMLTNLSSGYIGESYSTREATNGDKVTLDQLDSLSKISYPLCMRQLHETLRQSHHLKHFARLQFGLFLKAIGLSLEEALIFWRTEFTKAMDPDKFDKQYAYNVRHSYGKEGKRASYTPYSCMKIITGNQPGPGDSHGCPFKHSDPDILIKRLQMYKVSRDGIDEIVNLVKGSHYQIACAKYFELTHKVQDGSNISINHPNHYFDESVKLLKNIKIDPTNEKHKIRPAPLVKTEREWNSKPIKQQNTSNLEPQGKKEEDMNMDVDEFSIDDLEGF
eukprot:gene4885-5525_t